MNNSYDIIIQARTGSRRLPNKSLAQLGEHKLIEWVILRILLRFPANKVTLATTCLPEDDVFESFCEKYSINIYRGSVENVFNRFRNLASKSTINSTMIRVCADNPFVSPELMQLTISYYLQQKLDFCHSLRQLPYFPYVDGLGVEVFSSKIILELDETKLNLYDKEHVTAYFKNNNSSIKQLGMPTPTEYCFPNLSLDIDNAKDLYDIRKIIDCYGLKIDSSDSEIILAAMNYFCGDILTRKCK